MANFFEGVVNALKHPLDEAQFMWDVARGKTSLKDAPGEHQEMMNKTTVPILGNNKLAKNSDAVAGTIIGGILAAPVVGGMMGGSAAGGAGGGFSLGGYGTEGAFSNLFKPSATTSSSGVGGLNWSDIVSDSLTSSSGGGGISAGSLNGPSMSLTGNGVGGGSFDFSKLEGIGNALAHIQSPQNTLSGGGGRVGGGFRAPSKNMAQSLLDREYEALYNQPLYNKLT